MNPLLVKFRAVTPLMAGSNVALEEEATYRHDILGSVLSGRTLMCFHGQHHAGMCLCRKTAAKLDQGILLANTSEAPLCSKR